VEICWAKSFPSRLIPGPTQHLSLVAVTVAQSNPAGTRREWEIFFVSFSRPSRDFSRRLKTSLDQIFRSRQRGRDSHDTKTITIQRPLPKKKRPLRLNTLFFSYSARAFVFPCQSHPIQSKTIKRSGWFPRASA